MGNNLCCEEDIKNDGNFGIISTEGEYTMAILPPVTNPKVLHLQKTLPKIPVQTCKQDVEKQYPMKEKTKEYIYEGTWHKDQLWGYGTIYFPNQDYFQGHFREGKANGKGRFIFHTGSYFEGNILNNYAHGHGKFVSDQITYQGAWIQSKPSNGKYVIKGGEVIIETDNDQAFIHWKDGCVYHGQIRRFKPEGQGKINYPNGNVYKGGWQQGLLHGAGVYIWNDGQRYEGQYNRGVKQGHGLFEFKSGKRYIGQWKNGLQNGEGKVYKENVLLKQGLFQNGKYIRQSLKKMQHITEAHQTLQNLSNEHQIH